MTNIVPLNSQTHRSLRVNGAASARHGDNQRFVQVVVGEFPLLVVHYPILFSKDADTGAFFCGAMLGFDQGENLFLAEGTEHQGYRPLNLQRMPFYTAGEDLAIDLDHSRVGAEQGQALFTEAGQPTMYLESIMQTFRDLKPGSEVTRIFIATLLQHRLIEPVDIGAQFDDGSRRDLRDLYTINQSVLKDLPDAIVLELFRRGYLRLIYLMIASLKQIAELAKRKNALMLRGSESLSARGG
ncbi:MAG TPA: SapC family protein [Steroidobacteraceae bacterium]|jgi:hypothetical protein